MKVAVVPDGTYRDPYFSSAPASVSGCSSADNILPKHCPDILLVRTFIHPFGDSNFSSGLGVMGSWRYSLLRMLIQWCVLI